MMGWAQSVTVNRVTASWWLVIIEVPYDYTLGPVLFNVFINFLDVSLEDLLTVLNWEESLRH